MPWTSLAATALLLQSSAAAARELPRVDPTVEPATECRTSLVSFRDEQEGWLFTDCDEVLRTHDGGRSWQPDVALPKLLLAGSPRMSRAAQPPAQVELVAVRRLVWLGPRVGMMFGAGADVAFRTSDGGGTWQRVALPPSPGDAGHTSWGLDGTGVHSLDAVGERLWVCANGGRLLRSDDAGRTWRQLARAPFDSEDPCSALSFVDERDGWSGGRSGKLWRTADGGETWQPLSVIASEPAGHEQDLFRFTSLQRITPKLAWAETASGRFRTRDAGRTWERRPMQRTRPFAPVAVRIGSRLPWIALSSPGRKVPPEQLEPALREDASPWGEQGVVSWDLTSSRLALYREGRQLRASPSLTRSSGPLVPLEGVVRGSTRAWGWTGTQVFSTLDDTNWFTAGALPAKVQGLASRADDVLLAATAGGTLYRSVDLGSEWAATTSPLDASDFARATGAPPPGLPTPDCFLSAPSATLQVRVGGRGEHGGSWENLLTLRTRKGRVYLSAGQGSPSLRLDELVIGRAQAKRAVYALIAGARRSDRLVEACPVGGGNFATLSWSCDEAAKAPTHLEHRTGQCGHLLLTPREEAWPGSVALHPSEEGLPQAAYRIAQEVLRAP